jgi:hypothetical protein
MHSLVNLQLTLGLKRLDKTDRQTDEPSSNGVHVVTFPNASLSTLHISVIMLLQLQTLCPK